MPTKKHITNYKSKLLSKGWLLLVGFMLFFGVANAWSIDNSNINGRVVNNSLPVEYALLGTDYVVTDFVTYANSASEVSPVIRKYSSYFGIVYTMGRVGGSLYSSAKLAKAEEAAFAESAAKASSSEITTEETATATTVTSTEGKVTATSTEETTPTTTAEKTTASEGTTTSTAIKENVPDQTTTTEIKDGSLATAGSKLVDDLNLGKFVNKIGDYEVFENGEVFYRGMLKSDFEILESTGKLPATSETFTSPTLKYIKAVGYGTEADEIERVIVKFQMKPGTLDELKSIGVRNDVSSRIMNYYPDMPEVGSVSKWTENNALFKTEGDKYVKLRKLDEIQVNIGLGKGKALNEFNNRILNFQVVK